MKITKNNLLIPVFTFLMLFVICSLTAQTPAFPGAEGHGRYTTGGRGGTVYYVNSLSDTNTGNTTSREGTLRWCLGQNGTRTILFKVSGTIWLTSRLNITKGNVTIAGQSAPGDGICIAGFDVNVNADNVIMRYLRFRMGDIMNVSADGADALGGRFHSNIIVDHCSISWSTDECCSFYNNSNFTLQWCLISESLNFSKHSKGAHGYGGIWGGFGASFHHNLLAHHKSRVPRLGPGANTTPTNELCDIRNNVYYNYKGEGCYGGEAAHCNIVNNYYKGGPANASQTAIKKQRIIGIDKQTPENSNSFPLIEQVWGTFFIDGNVVEGQTAATNDNWTYGVYNQFHSKYGTISQTTKDTIRLAAPLPFANTTTHTAQNAYNQVLLYAGCSLHRDAIDARIINETQTNTTTYMGVQSQLPGIIDSQRDLIPAGADSTLSWPVLAQGIVPVDANIDGIPDEWLAANYPNNNANYINSDGYTLLEVYLNSLVESISNNQNNNAITEVNNPQSSKNQLKVRFNRAERLLIIECEDVIESISVFDVNGKMLGKKICNNNSTAMSLKNNNNIYIVHAKMQDKSVRIAKAIL
ncbi:MAG: pectate lyase [Paludibacter sp.]|jgi:hypothetical protein|nr:pectate lyase [Paludibacter sp.]